MTQVLYLDELTYLEAKKLNKKESIIFLPMGPLESHGPHLPLGVDIRGAEVTCKMAAEKIIKKGFQPIIAPTMPYTLADVAMPFSGTVTLSPKTLKYFINDLSKSFAYHEFENLVIFCHHGEIPNFKAINEAVKEAQKHGINILNSSAMFEGMRENVKLIKGKYPELDAHAGEAETALYMWKFPNLVKKDILNGLIDNWSPLRNNLASGAKDLVEAGGPQAYFGSPAKATAETGKYVYETLSDLLVQEIKNFMDTT